MENKDYVKNSEREISMKGPVLGDPSKLEEARKLNKILDNDKYKRAIVVLGGPNQNKRLEKAFSEYQNDPSAALIISGFGKDFENKGKYLVKSKGLDSIIVEDNSINTEENAINSLYSIKRGFPSIDKITIVSDYTHQPRSEMLFKKYAKESGKKYEIGFSGIKTEDKFHRVVYELGAFPLSLMPYRIHKKLTQKIRGINYRE